MPLMSKTLTIHTVAILASIGLGGAAATAAGGLSDGGGSTEPVAASCEGLAGTTFVSLNEYEVGLGEHGPILGHWQITFGASAYHYVLSDYSLSDPYRCSGPEASVTNGADGARLLSGFYQKEAGLLLWNDRWFRAVR